MTLYIGGRMLGGTGTLRGPSPNAQFKNVMEFLKIHLSKFAHTILNANIYNENALNSRLSRFITNAANEEFFFANSENMEDETKGNSPATDIGIYLKVDGDSGIVPPLITVFEGKRLTNQLQKKRYREYVIGHEENGKHISCGGIERFKLGIHGAKLNFAGMIGYMQDGTPESWQKRINSWICELSRQIYDPAWSSGEKLEQQKNKEGISEYSSIVNRAENTLYLTHFWIDLCLK